MFIQPCVYTLVSGRLLCFHSWLLQIMLQWTWVDKYFFQISLLILLDIYSGLGLLDHMVILFFPATFSKSKVLLDFIMVSSLLFCLLLGISFSTLSLLTYLCLDLKMSFFWTAYKVVLMFFFLSHSANLQLFFGKFKTFIFKVITLRFRPCFLCRGVFFPHYFLHYCFLFCFSW